MKRLAKLTAALVLLIGALFALTACGAITRIDIENRNRPRTEYVLGQELDLSGGLLSVWRGDDKETIALDDPDITVSGYDKDTVGDQRLTVEYGGLSTTLTVTVVSPLQVSGIPTDYFIGEPLDMSRGTLNITEEDGSTFSVPLTDEGVTVSGFDSSVANEALSVDVVYERGDATYTGEFVVAIYDADADSSLLRSPAKTSYQSHDEGLSLSGGYLTLQNEDGSLVKYITLTESMISGFDLSAATEANRETPLVQTLTVSYAGITKTFDIQITYSSVSLIKSCAAALSSLDWTNGIPAIDEEQGARAIEAAGLYFSVSRDDRNLIDETERDTVFRAAVAYGRQHWNALLNACRNVFTIADGTILYAEGATLENAEAALARLQAFETEGMALENIIINYGDVIMSGTTTLEGYLGNIRAFESVTEQLDYLLQLYQALEAFPQDWTEETITAQESVVFAAVEMLLNGGFISEEYSELHALIVNWRADFYEIIYTYAWLEQDTTLLNRVATVYRIAPFDTLADLFAPAATAFYNNLYYYQNGAAYDNTAFMLAYRDVAALMADWDASGSERDVWIFENLTLSVAGYSYTSQRWYQMMTSSNAPVSYNGITYPFLGNEAVAAFWELYLDTMEPILANMPEDGLTASFLQGYADSIDAMFRAFLALSPAEQHLFLCSESGLYASGAPSYIMVPTSDGYYSYFGLVVTEYYVSLFSNDTAKNMVYYLMQAVENYARREYNSFLSYFFQGMEYIDSAYGELGISDAMAFSARMGFVYNEYTALYDRYDTSTGSMTQTTNLGEWADEFEAIRQQALYVDSAYAEINDRREAYLAFLAAYEKMQSLVADLLVRAPEEIIQAYYIEPFVVTIDGTSYRMSLDFVLNYFRGYYGDLLGFNSIGGMQILSLYSGALQQTVLGVSDFIWATLEGESYGGTEEEALALINSLRALGAEQLYAFYALDGDYNSYRNAVSAFVEEHYSESVAALADILLELEYSYAHYLHDPTDVFPNGELYREAIVRLRTALQTAYAALSAADKDVFDAAFGAMYEYYMDVCSDITSLDI